MPEHPGAELNNGFRDFSAGMEPLRMRDPFAQTLDIFKIETRPKI